MICEFSEGNLQNRACGIVYNKCFFKKEYAETLISLVKRCFLGHGLGRNPGLNDQGDVLFTAGNHGYKNVWGVGHINSKAIALPTLPINYSNYDGASEITWQAINKSGLVIGESIFHKHIQPNLRQHIPELITWIQSEGIKQYRISSITDQNKNPTIKIAQCYNSDHVVFTLEDRIFTLNEGKIIDLSPVLLKEIQVI